MRSLPFLDEFKQEARGAVFTKEQAMQISLRLLSKELQSPDNTDEEKAVLQKAIEYFSVRYLDETQTETHAMLDAFNVARLSTDGIADGLKAVLFDAG